MKYFRRRRCCNRLSLLAIVALLWTQLAFASHFTCDVAGALPAQNESAHIGHGGVVSDACEGPVVPDSSNLLCESHCSSGDLSAEALRVLSVPAVGLLPAIPVVSVQRLPRAPDVDQSPGVMRSWHRPTAHPASLLLI
jgi:hypothetical protein